MPTQELICPQCGQANPAGSKFCRQCGTAIEPVDETPRCPNCGAEQLPEARFCWQCGADTKATAASEPPPEQPAPIAEPQALEAAEPPLAAKRSRRPIWRILLGLWPLWMILAGVVAYLRFAEDYYELETLGIVLVYVGLLAGVFKLAGAIWRSWRPASRTGRAATPHKKSAWQTVGSCATRLATWLLIGLVMIVTALGVEDEIGAEDVPDDMGPALVWAYLKPTQWIRDGLDQVADMDWSDVKLPSISNPFCASYDFSSGDGDCYTDSHGMRMCTSGTGGAPSASDCHRESGSYICQDSKGNTINMSAVCKSYPCTPLCKTLGIN